MEGLTAFIEKRPADFRD